MLMAAGTNGEVLTSSIVRNSHRIPPGTNRNRTAWFLLVVYLLFAPVVSSQTQITTAAPYPAQDVVVLALQALNPRVEHRQHVSQELVGTSGVTQDEELHLLEMQMNIVRETAKFGPVLLLAPDESTKTAVRQRCQEFQICQLLASDLLRIKVVPHDGVWIRDFGPQIESSGDSAKVVHWKYFDIRAEQAKREKFQQLETARLKLIETRQQEDQPDDFSRASSPDSHKAIVSAIDDKLYLLREYSEILSEASVQRPNDDSSAFDIADAVLVNPRFHYEKSGIALDGGNLIKLEDGRCLTTRELRSRNQDQDANLDQDLEKLAGCKGVTFLDPLPGPVIEHVDMFILPAGGKRILLASYDLTKPFAQEYWNKLSDSERELAMNAGLAMELDAERLRQLGYEVVTVPSPFPRILANGHTYYPAMLNALVRIGAGGRSQLLVPSYQDYESDIQSSALAQIRGAFGVDTDVIPIESTEAAKAQGAIHCLTLTVPLRLSVFGDLDDAARRAAYLVRKNQLNRDLARDIASQIPPNGLQGSWAILEQNERSDETPVDLYPQRIFFGKNEFQEGIFHQLESQGIYTIDRMDLTSWVLHFRFPDQNVPAVVQWLGRDEVKLLLLDSGTTLLLRRVASEQSPFKGGEQVSHPPTQATPGPSRKHATSNNPDSGGKGSPSLQPVQP